MKYCNCLVFVLLTIVSATVAVEVDYCSNELCSGKNHIACRNTGDFGPSCPPERSVVPMTADVVALLLKKHNTARMNIANGEVKGYSTANRMTEMSWDNELAKLAEMNAKTCVFAHDECRNTVAFKSAGQNLGIIYSSSPNYSDVSTAINELFDSWFDEHIDGNMNQIQNLTTITAANGKSFGHFTQIVIGSSSKVGCAITQYFKDSTKNTLLVCDYSLTNIISWPVYTTGQPCSGCKSGCSRNYPGLCNTNEVAGN